MIETFIMKAWGLLTSILKPVGPLLALCVALLAFYSHNLYQTTQKQAEAILGHLQKVSSLEQALQVEIDARKKSEVLADGVLKDTTQEYQKQCKALVNLAVAEALARDRQRRRSNTSVESEASPVETKEEYDVLIIEIPDDLLQSLKKKPADISS